MLTKRRIARGAAERGGNMEAAPRLWDQEEPENVIWGEYSLRRPELGSFSDLQEKGLFHGESNHVVRRPT